MATASAVAARFLLLEIILNQRVYFRRCCFLFLLVAAKHCCLRWRPGRKRSKSPLIWWGQNKRSSIGVCLNGFRYFGGEPTKQKPCFFCCSIIWWPFVDLYSKFQPEYPCSETMSWRQVIHFFFVFSNKMVFRIHLPILLQKYLKEFFSESIFQELLFRIDFVWFSPNIWTDSRPWGFCRNLHTTRSSWHWMMAIYRPSVHLMASTIIGSKRVSFKCLRDYQVARTR